jgi:transcriptional regulator with XRE-family HTH domain
MDHNEYFKQFEQDPEYVQAEQELKLIFEIADHVLRLRLERGWSQAELAEHAETKQANISRLESGLSNPSVKFLEKLAKALDTNISVRFEKTQEPSISIATNTGNQSQEVSYLVPNWPRSETTYKSYEQTSPKSENL